MPKVHTLPPLYDEVLQLNISSLKRDGCLKEGHIFKGVSTWHNRFNEERGSISIYVDMTIEEPFIELDYNYNGEPRNYKVNIVRVASNLGKGFVLFFVCPKTFKRCRKLYSIGGYFLHREAFKGCMYESQTRSKKMRNIEKKYGAYFDQEKIYKELYSKYFKRFYNGKPTKRYLKLKRKIDCIDKIKPNEIETLFLN